MAQAVRSLAEVRPARHPCASEDPSADRQSILGQIGRTPLLRLRKIEAGLGRSSVKILAKAEWFNPGGSVKDRPAARMILKAVESGRLTPEKTIIDATSGNTGIAYAMIGAALGYRVKLFMPANASAERKRILRAYGAELVLTDAQESTDGAIIACREAYASASAAYFYPDQYSNDENWRAHYETTGPEILEQTAGSVTHFVAGLGTSGTLMGTGRRLREFNPKMQVIGVQPDSPFHGLEGLKHMKSALVPSIYDPTFPNRVLEVRTEEAYEMVERLARQEGLLVGMSAGAALAAAVRLAGEAPEGVVVTVFPDSADRYLSEKFWDQWSLS